MLSEFDAACASKVPPQGPWARMLERTNRRACVLHRYEAAIGVVDFADAIELELSAQQPTSACDRGRAHLRAPSARTWGPDSFSSTCPLARGASAPRPASLGLARSLVLHSASAPATAPAAPRARREGTVCLPCACSSPKAEPRPRHRRGAPGPQKRVRSHIECGAGDVVAWCAGHILQMAPPEAYGDAYKTWRLESLPITPSDWKLEVSSPELVASIRRLLRDAKRVSSTRATPIARVSCSSTRCSTFSATPAPSIAFLFAT